MRVRDIILRIHTGTCHVARLRISQVGIVLIPAGSPIIASVSQGNRSSRESAPHACKAEEKSLVGIRPGGREQPPCRSSGSIVRLDEVPQYFRAGRRVGAGKSEAGEGILPRDTETGRTGVIDCFDDPGVRSEVRIVSIPRIQSSQETIAAQHQVWLKDKSRIKGTHVRYIETPEKDRTSSACYPVSCRRGTALVGNPGRRETTGRDKGIFPAPLVICTRGLDPFIGIARIRLLGYSDRFSLVAGTVLDKPQDDGAGFRVKGRIADRRRRAQIGIQHIKDIRSRWRRPVDDGRILHVVRISYCHPDMPAPDNTVTITLVTERNDSIARLDVFLGDVETDIRT